MPSEPERICPRCGGEMERGEMQWLIGWFPHTDDRGVKHSHDPNRRTEFWFCKKCRHADETNTHWFVPCPACGWTGDQRL